MPPILPMPLKLAAILIAANALAGAIVVLVFVLRATPRPHWGKLALQVASALCLLGVFAVLVPAIIGPDRSKAFFDSAAPVSDTTTLYSIIGRGLDNIHPGYDAPTLEAINGQTGKLRWQHSLLQSYTYRAVSDDKAVYLVSETQPATLSALRGMDGATLWQTPLPDATVWGDPVLVDGLVALPFKPPSSGVGQRPTWLLAYRATDGQQVWNVTRPDDMSDAMVKASDEYGISLYASPGIIVADLVTQPLYPSVWAVRSSDGQLLWTKADPMTPISSVISVSDLSADIIVGRRDVDPTTVVALDAQTGERLRSDHGSRPHGAQYLDSAAIFAGVVYASRGPSETPGLPTVTAYDAASGHVLWERTYQARYAGTLLASKDAIYTLELEGVTARRPSDGSILWVDHSSALADARVYPSSYAAGNSITAEGANGIPSLVGSAIYVNVAKSRNSILGFTTYVQNNLYAVDQHSGKLYWAIALGPERVIRD